MIFTHLHEALKESIKLENRENRYKQIMSNRANKIVNQRKEINRLIEDNKLLKERLNRIGDMFTSESVDELSKTERLIIIRAIIEGHYEGESE